MMMRADSATLDVRHAVFQLGESGPQRRIQPPVARQHLPEFLETGHLGDEAGSAAARAGPQAASSNCSTNLAASRAPESLETRTERHPAPAAAIACALSGTRNSTGTSRVTQLPMPRRHSSPDGPSRMDCSETEPFGAGRTGHRGDERRQVGSTAFLLTVAFFGSARRLGRSGAAAIRASSSATRRRSCSSSLSPAGERKFFTIWIGRHGRLLHLMVGVQGRLQVPRSVRSVVRISWRSSSSGRPSGCSFTSSMMIWVRINARQVFPRPGVHHLQIDTLPDLAPPRLPG